MSTRLTKSKKSRQISQDEFVPPITKKKLSRKVVEPSESELSDPLDDDVQDSDGTDESGAEASPPPKPKHKLIKKKLPVEPSSPVEAIPEEPPKEDRKALPMYIDNYSSLSIVVRGDTWNYKDELARLGGMFNRRLTGGAGWVFKIKDRELVENYVDTKNSGGDVSSIVPPIIQRAAPVQPRPVKTYKSVMENRLTYCTMNSHITSAFALWTRAGGDGHGFKIYVANTINTIEAEVAAEMSAAQ